MLTGVILPKKVRRTIQLLAAEATLHIVNVSNVRMCLRYDNLKITFPTNGKTAIFFRIISTQLYQITQKKETGLNLRNPKRK